MASYSFAVQSMVATREKHFNANQSLKFIFVSYLKEEAGKY